MTAITLPNLSLNAGFLNGESGWADEMNRALRIIDAMVNLRVVSRLVTSPPAAASGDAYIVADGSVGEWSGKAALLAIWMSGDDLPTPYWEYVQPKLSWRAWVTDENSFYQYNGGNWVKDDSGIGERFSANIGDGGSANFFVDHGLGSRDVSVTVRRNASPWDDILVDISRPTENRIEISGFTSAVGVNEYRVIVKK